MYALLRYAAFAGLLAGAPAERDGAEEAAAELVAQAEEKVRSGRHAEAVRLYAKAAQSYPDTPAGEIAARRARPNAFLGQADVVRHGPSSNRLDVVVMGDGYELDELDSFAKVADDLPRIFQRNDVFEEYYSYLNVIRADVVSEENGIDAFGREKSTALGGAMSAGEQGQVTVDREVVRGILREECPESDGFAIVLVPLGTLGTGGGGVAAVAAREFETAIHEWGHAFANLGDEYSTFTGYRGDPTGRPNVSATPDPEEVPWAHFLAARVRGVGVYEGADGRVRGAWKPTTAGCLMGDGGQYCPVCREAVILRLHEFVDPIDAARPEVSDEILRVARDGEPLRFEVRVMSPKSHRLEVSWWVFPAAEAPEPAPYVPGAAAAGERDGRGPLAPIERKPEAIGRNAKDGGYAFTFAPREHGPGTYLVFVRAVDTAKIRGERHPWVLRDELGVLQSERVWQVVVE